MLFQLSRKQMFALASVVFVIVAAVNSDIAFALVALASSACLAYITVNFVQRTFPSYVWLWCYRLIFAISSVGLIPTGYILFGYLTLGEGGFNPHPILDTSNFGIGLAVIFLWPLMLACIVTHIVCWCIYLARRSHSQDASVDNSGVPVGNNSTAVKDDCTQNRHITMP